jgi:Cys-tRNA(Pro)/Cys-tRNA(Cys) deacylase
MGTIKTNAMRILDSKRIEYIEHVLDIKEAIDGVTCSKMLNIEASRMFKTLVTVGKSGNYYVFIVPVAAKLDLKKAANSVGEKNVEMIPMKNLLNVAGYVHGGCSPIGMKKNYVTVIDKSALDFDKIIFSGGKIGFFVEVDIKKVIDIFAFKVDNLVEEGFYEED